MLDQDTINRNLSLALSAFLGDEFDQFSAHRVRQEDHSPQWAVQLGPRFGRGVSLETALLNVVRQVREPPTSAVVAPKEPA